MSKERVHKIIVDYGMTDYYKFYKKKYGTKLTAGEYNKIISEYNLLLQDSIIEDELVYKMPYLRTELELKKAKRGVTIENGKVKNTLPIDWPATNRLWDNNPEAKEKKLLVRLRNKHTGGYVFRISFSKRKLHLDNKILFRFATVRDFKRKIKKAILHPDKDINAFLLYAEVKKQK